MINDLFKVVKHKKTFYIKVLTFNKQVWTKKAFRYLFVTDSYPTEYIKYAKKFETEDNVKEWLKEVSENMDK